MVAVTTSEDVGDFRVVTLRGEIDAYTAPSLRSEFERRIEETSSISTLVIDLAAVTFLDSSAVGALVGALRLLRARGGTLRVVEPEGAAKRIFAQTGLDAILALYPTRELALSRGETG